MLRGRTIELLEIGWGRWVWSLGVFRELVVCMMARDQRQCSKFLVNCTTWHGGWGLHVQHGQGQRGVLGVTTQISQKMGTGG